MARSSRTRCQGLGAERSPVAKATQQEVKKYEFQNVSMGPTLLQLESAGKKKVDIVFFFCLFQHNVLVPHLLTSLCNAA